MDRVHDPHCVLDPNHHTDTCTWFVSRVVDQTVTEEQAYDALARALWPDYRRGGPAQPPLFRLAG